MSEARASEDGDVAVAHAVQEQLEESGARARLKEWLYDALESAGWTASMDNHASKFAADQACTASDADPPPSVEKIAQHIMQKGFDSVPDAVRDRLLREVLAAVREATVKDSSAANRNLAPCR